MQAIISKQLSLTGMCHILTAPAACSCILPEVPCVSRSMHSWYSTMFKPRCIYFSLQHVHTLLAMFSIESTHSISTQSSVIKQARTCYCYCRRKVVSPLCYMQAHSRWEESFPVPVQRCMQAIDSKAENCRPECWEMALEVVSWSNWFACQSRSGWAKNKHCYLTSPTLVPILHKALRHTRIACPLLLWSGPKYVRKYIAYVLTHSFLQATGHDLYIL